MTRAAIAILFLLCAGAGARPQNAGCAVPDQMTKDQKIPCVKAGRFMVDQPTLSAEQLANGPDFDPAATEKSRFEYFTEGDNVSCYFRPHYAFMKVKGDSMKFQCWHMTTDGAFYGTKGELIRVDAVKVVVKPAKDGEQSVALYASNDTNNEHELKADHFKVKYLKPPFPNHNTRFNEVFTEVAASRIMWVLGFPADHVYPVGSVACIGCGDDPFTNDLKGNTASLKDAATVFKVVSAEREVPWRPSSRTETRPGHGKMQQSFILSAPGRTNKKWNMTLIGWRWASFTITMRLRSRTGFPVRPGAQR